MQLNPNAQTKNQRVGSVCLALGKLKAFVCWEWGGG